MNMKRLAICGDCPMMARGGYRRGPDKQTVARAVQGSFRRTFVTSSMYNSKPVPAERTIVRRPQAVSQTTRVQRSSSIAESADLASIHTRILNLTSSVLRLENGKLPTEQRVLSVLKQFDALQRQLVDAKTLNAARNHPRPQTTATAALLGSVNARQHPVYLTKASLLLLVSEKAEEVVRHESVFITRAILKAYVDLQTALHQPHSFRDVFALYASKPLPQLSAADGSLTLERTNPNKISAAVDRTTANAALTAALNVRDLPLALAIVDNTFCTVAFRRAKFLRQVAIPVAGLVASPIAAYALALQYGAVQTAMNPAMATGVAFAGIMTYVMSVVGLGYVAVTTANDQMERVTWAPGIPLGERWMREDERKALDRIACAWGFKEPEKRGDEEGEEWEALKEFAGLRGMIVDRTELMQGME